MKRGRLSAYGIILLTVGMVLTSIGWCEEISPGVCLFDTGASSPQSYASGDLAARAGWTQVPEETTAYQFKGDALFFNDKIAVVLRRGGSGAELYTRTGNEFTKRALFAPAAQEKSVGFASASIIENSLGSVTLDISFQSGGVQSLALTLELKMGDCAVSIKPKEGVERLKVIAPSRFAVMPDFFADDMVIDARQIPVAESELPSENFFLQPLGNGSALLMSVCKNRGQDIRVSFSGESEQRAVSESEIVFGKEGEIWLAALEQPGIWHSREITKNDAGQILQLEWHPSYPAQWRVDWQCADKLTDSWEMLAESKDGYFKKYGWLGNLESAGTEDWLRKEKRERWTTVLGWFPYPCWINKDNQGCLQPLAKNVVQFEGPALIYPINRIQETPLDRFTVVDIVRATLGVGPCEYILDLEKQKQSFKGIATCACRDILNEIYESKKQKERRSEVEKALQNVMKFVKHIRGRINQYVDFGHELLAYLKRQKEENPGLSDFLSEMETLTQAIDANYAKRKDDINTPDYAEKLVNDFRTTLIGYEGEDALKKCKTITKALTNLGGNQDELVGECRLAVRRLRQRAALAAAVNPKAAEIAKEIRQRTQSILLNPVSYEAPRH